MDRRIFVQSLAGAGMLSGQVGAPARAQASGSKTRLYLLDYFSYRQGDQATRLTDFLSSQVPLMSKHARALGVFTAVFAPHMQTTVLLRGFSSADEMDTASGVLAADPGYRKAHEEFEKGADAPYDTLQRVLLQATDFSPEIVPLAEKPKSLRYFEIRIYHAPTQRQLGAVHERFVKAEINIFHRSGVNPILYADTAIGPEMPNLTYIVPFASLADREKAWDTFQADPEWIKVRAESVARDGQIVNFQNITLWRATAYSPIQ